MTTMAPVLVKRYEAKSNAEAVTMYSHEASLLGPQGYVPGTQVWVAPPVARRIITPIMLVIAAGLIGLAFFGLWLGLLVGIVLALLYTVAVKPNGILTVTYVQR